MAKKKPEPFSKRLQRLREAAGLSQSQLALRSGLSIRTVQGIEQGWRDRPMAQTVAALATGLGVSMACVMGLEE